jgi:FkbM family methyltransferase
MGDFARVAGINWLRKKFFNTPRNLVQGRLDKFLHQVTGVIHIGANIGQERKKYDAQGLDVLWIEPIPEVYETLQENIRNYPRQRALKYLLSATGGETVEFNVTSNNGQSSSILPLKEHKEIWPDVEVSKKLPLVTSTFVEMIAAENIDLLKYQAVVLDTQGSELLVLQGMVESFKYFRFIKTEAADFEAYAGCCRDTDLIEFLNKHGFSLIGRRLTARRPKIGSYYDLVLAKRQQ